MSNVTTLDAASSDIHASDAPEAAVAMLVLVWAATDPRRVGEVLVPGDAGEPSVFGRGDADSGELRAVLLRQRPGRNEGTPALDNPFLSRRHLVLRADDGGVAIENLGKRPLLHEGEPADEVLVARPGETVEIPGQALFLCVSRARVLPPVQSLAVGDFPVFGEPDEHGLVGESPLAWQLRDQCALIGSLSPHVLLLGESGTGKELVAQAIHAQSARRAKTMVSRNSATFPPGLIDAELFGNVASYPNPGMVERPGVVGEADGSTLFLDEIAEMPIELQSHLLRVLDDAGEYQRLGEARRRRADLRVIAATNRPVASLKHDLAARFGLKISLAALNDLREDVPLLARHLLRRQARKDPPIGARFFAGWDGRVGEPRLSPALARALVTHHYTTNVRELDSLLLSSLVGSRGATFELTDALRSQIVPARAAAPPRGPAREYAAEEIRAMLEKHRGVRERVWRELGMPNRYVLQRLMKKLGIDSVEE